MHHRAIRHFHALPAVVAVHRVIAPPERRDLPHTQLAHLLLQLPHIIAPAVGRRVAPVHEAMHKHFLDFLLFGHLEQRE